MLAQIKRLRRNESIVFSFSFRNNTHAHICFRRYEEKNETRAEFINEFAAFGFLTTLLGNVGSRRVFSGGVLLVRPQ